MTLDINWAKDVLNDKAASVEKIVETPYSTVHKLTSGEQDYYLKKVPEAYFIEAAILERLGAGDAKNDVPVLVCSDNKLSAFIVKSDGQVTVRHYLKDNDMDIDLVGNGLMTYQAVQTATTNDIDFYVQKGVPDWRLNKFPSLYQALIQDDELMTLWQIINSHRAELHALQYNVVKMCERLASFGVPDTLNHCDLHNNNIVIDATTQKLTVIDWAEVSIGNPILSTEPFFRSLRKHHGMTRETPEYKALQDIYLEKWGVPLDEGRRILNALGGIYYVFCMQNVIRITGDRFERWAGDVTAALNDFIHMTKTA